MKLTTKLHPLYIQTLLALSAIAFTPSVSATEIAAEAKESSGAKIASSLEASMTKVEARFMNLGQALIQSTGVVVSFEEKVKNEREINQTAYELKQGTSLCEKLINQARSNAFNSMSRANSGKASVIFTNELFSPLAQGLKEQQQYQANLNQFCSTTQFIEGECDVAASPELQYAHVNVANLFGSDGSVTRSNALDKARDATIDLLSGVTSIPSSTAMGFDENGESILPNGPRSERYENTRQRWIALTSLTRDALYRASEAHTYAPMDIYDYNNTITATNTRYYEQNDGVESVLGQRAREKRPFNVVMLGDSHTAGMLFPNTVESTLQKVNPTAKVQTMATNDISFADLSKIQPKWLENLKLLEPDLVIVNYGTKESSENTLGATESTWQSNLIAIKNAVPNAHVLIVGTPELLAGQSGECGTLLPNLERVQVMQQQLSSSLNISYWSWQDAMGGQCSMKKNLYEGLAKKTQNSDQVVQFSGKGYVKYGNLLGEYILGSYAKVKLASQSILDTGNIPNNLVEFIKKEEGFSSCAFLDNTQWSIGHGNGMFTDSNGVWRKVKEGDCTTKEQAHKDLLKSIPDYLSPITKRIGDGWNKLNSTAQEVLLSLSYNYGPGIYNPKSKYFKSEVYTAARNGDLKELATAVRNLQYDPPICKANETKNAKLCKGKMPGHIINQARRIREADSISKSINF